MHPKDKAAQIKAVTVVTNLLQHTHEKVLFARATLKDGKK